jgi:trigger factor
MSEELKKSRLIDRSPSRKEIELEIPAEEVDQEYARILGEYAGRVKIAGFRKGHAPLDMVRSLFDRDILHDVYDVLVPRALDRELKALNLDPVNAPAVQNLEHEPGRPLRCTMAFEVLPDFDLPDYRTIRVSKRQASVDDAEVEKALADIQAGAAEYVPVSGRGVADGDYVVAEIQGRDVKTRRLLPVEKSVVLAGHAENEPALNEVLRGQKAGEERVFRVSYARDHGNRRVAGRDIEYRLRVSEVKEKKTPELNDEFAKTVGEYAGLADLRDRIRKELIESRERANRSAAASDVLAEISKQVALELPESVVEKEALAILRRNLEAARGAPRVSAPAFEELKAQARRQAVERLTNRLILEKIARQEGLEVGEADVQAEIRALAQANKVSEAAVADAVKREGRMEEIRETLLIRKTVDFLVKNVIIN